MGAPHAAVPELLSTCYLAAEQEVAVQHSLQLGAAGAHFRTAMLAAEATKQRKRAEAAQQRAEQARMAASDPALAPPPQHVSSGANSGGNGALDGLAMTGTAGTAPPGPPWQLGAGPMVRLQERLPATRMLTAILVLWVASIASGLMLHTGASRCSYRMR